MTTTEHGSANAPAVLLVHGGGLAGWMWREVAQGLAVDHRVLVPDLPGHGGPGEYRSHADGLALLRGMLDDLPHDRPVAVVGFSLGAQLALLLALERPERVQRVVVVSGMAQPVPAAGALLLLGRVLAPLGRRPSAIRRRAEAIVPADLVDAYVATATAMTPRSIAGLSRANFGFRIPATWSGYPGRALLLAGAQEHRLLLRGMRRMHHALPGSVLEVVDGAAHDLPLRHAPWLVARIGDWLRAP